MATTARRGASTAVFAVAFVVLGLPDFGHGVAWPDMRGDLGRPLADLGVFLTVAAAGYLAVAALIAAREPRGLVATSVRACGQRSMTCYLAQSVLFVAILAPYAGGLGATISVAGAAVLAVGVWLVTVLASVGMARFGYRGPGEALLRRLTYGPVRR